MGAFAGTLAAWSRCHLVQISGWIVWHREHRLAGASDVRDVMEPLIDSYALMGSA